MFKAQFVAGEISGLPYQHASSIIRLRNGDLLCAWYAATEEKNADQRIVLARLAAGLSDWSRPEMIVPGNLAQGNPVLYQHGDGRVWLIYVDMVLPENWEKCRVYILHSEDNGATWGDRRTLVEFLGYMPRNHPLCLSDGSVVLPLYDERQGRSVFLITSDGGETWELGGDIITEPGNEQATLAQLSDGSLVAFMRTRRPDGYIWQARSFNGGWHWTPAVETAFPNPDADTELIQLSNGHLLLVFNNSGSLRTPLSVALSTDEASSWSTIAHLETEPGQYDYPSAVVGVNGLVHLTYSWHNHERIKHIAFDEAWVLEHGSVLAGGQG
ncbi:MAG: exo-alpha-sialidase [Anaerolineales bacterium]|nr:exo-alpha-sialidase [Anaerolineales bacterium]